MLAGIAAADITPPIGTPLQGHFSTHPESRGILAPLEIRTVAFRSDSTTLILITADLIGVPLEMTRRIRSRILQKHSIPQANILIAATHTHCGPAILPCIGLTPQPEILAQIASAILTSVDEAIAWLEPVTLGIGASAAHFNINRRPLPGQTDMFPNAAGVVDKRVRVLRMDRMDGSPLGILFHYSCHPTTKNGSDGMISPDYPGFARAEIEMKLQCRAAFLPGCSGDIRPNIVDGAGRFVSATVEQLTAAGEELGGAVVNAAKFTRTAAAERLGAAEAEVFFPFGDMLPAEEMERMSKRVDQPLRGDWATRQLATMRKNDPASAPRHGDGEKSVMQAVRIGPLVMVGIPGEPVQEIGYKIERVAAKRFDVPPPLPSPGVPGEGEKMGGRDSSGNKVPPPILEFEDVWPVGYANDQIGYFCTPRMYQEGGYEPTAYVVYDRPAAFSGEQKIICDQAADLLHRLLK